MPSLPLLLENGWHTWQILLSKELISTQIGRWCCWLIHKSKKFSHIGIEDFHLRPDICALPCRRHYQPTEDIEDNIYLNFNFDSCGEDAIGNTPGRARKQDGFSRVDFFCRAYLFRSRRTHSVRAYRCKARLHLWRGEGQVGALWPPERNIRGWQTICAQNCRLAYSSRHFATLTRFVLGLNSRSLAELISSRTGTFRGTVAATAFRFLSLPLSIGLSCILSR